MTDIIEEDGQCAGIVAENMDGDSSLRAPYTILASGGIGGLYRHSTNFPHLTGDAVRIAKNMGSGLKIRLCSDSSDNSLF